jgi:hypothetical protein
MFFWSRKCRASAIAGCESLSRLIGLRAVPDGTRFSVFLGVPGTSVSGFHVLPLRGWSRGAFATARRDRSTSLRTDGRRYKKKTGLVGPASSASSWMRLHHNAARLALRVVLCSSGESTDRKI